MSTKKQISFLKGSDGRGKRGKISDDANSLRSDSRARLLALLCEGEIKGLVNGTRSVYIDNTPLVNESGAPNFQGVNWAFRHGLPSQEPIPGFVGVENEIPVGEKVTTAIPITRTLLDAGYTSCRVTIRIPALVHQTDKSMKRTRVKFQLAVRHLDGA